jgi:class 3 adenylate cyclase
VATLAFLFTDIEGSTRLWSEQRGLMGEALRGHDELIVGAVTACGGTVFKHTGDGVCAVFDSARAAIDAAARAQRALTAAAWGELGRLRVRMAVHVGEAQPRGDDWWVRR